MIELKSVTKLYGSVIGVNDFTLALEPGAYGLLGPNGAGKSTLLNLITGQLRPTLGTVTVMGQSPVNNSEFFRKLGYCPGGEGMYSEVTGYDWVRYLQRLQGQSPRDADQAASAALDLVGMTSSMNRPIATYSRGMRQRTKLAQAIAHQPELLILDEPFNGLDPIGRHELTQVLKAWLAPGKTLIFASHLLHEIESITQSFILIFGGRLLASGTADDVHRMMAGLPNEIRVQCSNPHLLASKVMAEGVANSVRIQDEILLIQTAHPIELYRQLPRWVVELELVITEMRSADESLQALFDSLMKLHRGEV